MTMNQNSEATAERMVTPEWLEHVADMDSHVCHIKAPEFWKQNCPACALNKAAEALREAHDITAGLWSRAREAEAERDRLAEENKGLRVIANRYIEENRSLAEENRRLLETGARAFDRARRATPSEAEDALHEVVGLLADFMNIQTQSKPNALSQSNGET